jgi:HAD superfamily hydrolase (TIGR01509 family)
MKVKLKAVLFDLDDTIFDRIATQGAVLGLILEAMPDLFAGVDRLGAANAFYVADAEGLKQFTAGARQEVVRSARSRAFLRMLGLPEQRADKITELYLVNYAKVGRPVDGARKILTKLARRFALGLISNGFSDIQRQKLSALGFAELFDCVVFSADVGMNKPDPEIFRYAARLLSCKPEACLFVGNSYEHDMVGALKAGMATCWFNPRGVRLLPGKTRPTFEIASLHALPRILISR